MTSNTLSQRNQDESVEYGKKEIRKIKRISRERSACSKDRQSNYTLSELEKKDKVRSGKAKRMSTSRDESFRRKGEASKKQVGSRERSLSQNTFQKMNALNKQSTEIKMTRNEPYYGPNRGKQMATHDQYPKKRSNYISHN